MKHPVFINYISLLFVVILGCGKQITSSGQGNGGAEIQVPGKEISFNKVVFPDPITINKRESDTRIMDSLIRYVHYTPKDEIIHVSIYLFSYAPLVDEIIAAHHRGVNIQLIVDNGRTDSEVENKETVLRLMGSLRAPSRLISFKSDASGNAINHDKYALFSRINLPEGFVRNVVFNTSHNFILDGTKKIQDAIIISNEKLYQAFLDNWNDIASRAKSGMKNFTYKEVDLDSIKAYFFPRRLGGNWDGKDTFLEIFDKISDYKNANIRVAMSDWSRVEVAQRLTELQQLGAKVEVIGKDKSDAAVLTELNNLKNAGGYVKIIKMSEKNTHSKITIINGTWEGRKQQVVFCGSHNYTYNALKNNNEVMLMLKSSKIVRDYNDYFDQLKSVL